MPRAALIAAVLLPGCGSATVEELPGAAGPARSPALTRAPAGGVVPVGRAPEAVAVAARGDTAAAGGRSFVIDPRADTLRIIDARGRERSVAAPAGPTGVAATADGRRVAVVGGRERTVVLYDGRTGRRLGSAPAGVGPTRVAVHRGDAYVTDTRGGSFLVYSLRPALDLVRRVSLRGSPYGLAIDPVRNRLWVTLTEKNELAELPATRLPRIVRRFPTVRQPDGVAVDSRTGRVYVVGAARLQIVDP